MNVARMKSELTALSKLEAFEPDQARRLVEIAEVALSDRRINVDALSKGHYVPTAIEIAEPAFTLEQLQDKEALHAKLSDENVEGQKKIFRAVLTSVVAIGPAVATSGSGPAIAAAVLTALTGVGAALSRK